MSTFHHHSPAHRRLMAAVAAMTMVMLAGCGFQLRGTTNIPQVLSPVYLQCDLSQSSLCNNVRTQLQRNNVAIAEQPEAGYRLILRDWDSAQRATALTDTAAAAEYDLTVSVDMALFTPDGVPLRPADRLSTSQTYRYDENTVLAKNRERRELIESLNERLAQQVLYALSPFTENRVEQIRAEYDAAQSEAPSPQSPSAVSDDADQ